MNRRDLLKSVPVAAAVAAGGAAPDLAAVSVVPGGHPFTDKPCRYAPTVYRVNFIGWDGFTATARLSSPSVSVGDVVQFISPIGFHGPRECYVESIEIVPPRPGELIVEREA